MCNIALVKHLHEQGKASSVMWRQCQVDVVGHQHIRMDFAAGLLRKAHHPAQVVLEVVLAKEAGISVVSTLNQVDGHIGNDESGMARHTPILAQKRHQALTQANVAN
jgi:hypothetical protein